MAGREYGSASSGPPAADEITFPQFPHRDTPTAPSIISSRMTDIASEDGGDDDETQRATSSHRRSVLASDALSRPGTAKTALSSRGGWSQAASLRGGPSSRRKSGAPSTAGSLGGRPTTSASRSHVPSLTSHAFFRPMSSQKLQAQRGVTRSSAVARQQFSADDPGPETGYDTPRHSVVSNPVAKMGRQPTDDGEMQPPPSRGTEMTEQETIDRITANTSPTQGHYATASLSESVRPLQRKAAETRGLTLNMDRSYMNTTNLPPPIKSPRSFRSSFLMPSRNESAHNGSNRSMPGGEKLDSGASSPQLTPADPHAKPSPPKPNPRLGNNYQYFEGNTVFCLGGRFQNTRHRPVNIATGVLFTTPGVLFFIFCCPWIWANISPAIPITFAYVFYVCVSSFLHASASDPGVCIQGPLTFLSLPAPPPTSSAYSLTVHPHRFSLGTCTNSLRQMRTRTR